MIIFSAFSKERAEDQDVFSVSCNTTNAPKAIRQSHQQAR